MSHDAADPDPDPTAAQWQEIVTVARDRAQAAISLPGYTLTETGLVAHSPTLADALATGTILARAHNVTLWAIGEWAIDARARFGASYDQLVADSGLSSSTIGKAIWLARTYGEAERRPGLSPSHHEAAAPLSAPERATLLDRAEREGMTRGEVRALVRSPVRDANGERDLGAAYVTVIVADVRGAAWSLAVAFGDALPALVRELQKLKRKDMTREERENSRRLLRLLHDSASVLDHLAPAEGDDRGEVEDLIFRIGEVAERIEAAVAEAGDEG